MEWAYCRVLFCILIIHINGRAGWLGAPYLLCRTTRWQSWSVCFLWAPALSVQSITLSHVTLCHITDEMWPGVTWHSAELALRRIKTRWNRAVAFSQCSLAPPWTCRSILALWVGGLSYLSGIWIQEFPCLCLFMVLVIRETIIFLLFNLNWTVVSAPIKHVTANKGNSPRINNKIFKIYQSPPLSSLCVMQSEGTATFIDVW